MANKKTFIEVLKEEFKKSGIDVDIEEITTDDLIGKVFGPNSCKKGVDKEQCDCECTKDCEPSKGDQLIGVGFNPSEKIEVTILKKSAAATIDLLAKDIGESELKDVIIAMAIESIIDSTMKTVKALTF